MTGILTLINEWSWLGGIIGGVGTFISNALGGAKKWLILAIAVLLVVIYILSLKLTIERQDTRIVTLQSQVETAAESIKLAQSINQENLKVFDGQRQRHAAELLALTADRDRLANLVKTTKIVKEKIYVEAQKCVGVPPAGRAIADWVRDNPDPAGGR